MIRPAIAMLAACLAGVAFSPAAEAASSPAPRDPASPSSAGGAKASSPASAAVSIHGPATAPAPERVAMPAPARAGWRPGRRATRRPASDAPRLDGFVDPPRAADAHLLSPPLSPLPCTEFWDSLSGGFGKWKVGKARYRRREMIFGIGGAWRPAKVPRLGIGLDLVAFDLTGMRTEVPPLIEEKRTRADLGRLAVHVRYVALNLHKGKASVALTPFVRVGLPTDTSRLRSDRHLPLRYLLDVGAVSAPVVSPEAGLLAGVVTKGGSFYTHQSFLAALPLGDRPHVLWSAHYGAALRARHGMGFGIELSTLVRLTRSRADELFGSVGLGLVMRGGSRRFSTEWSLRFGLSPDAWRTEGIVTVGMAGAFTLGRPSGGVDDDRMPRLRSGELGSPTAAAVLEDHRRELLDCYALGLARAPDAELTAEAFISIDPSGSVASATVVSMSRRDPEVKQCLERVLKRLTFAERPDAVDVSHTFRFSPGEVKRKRR